MEKRKFKRFPSNFTGMIIIEGKSYVGHLKNISEEGVGYLSMFDSFYYPKKLTLNKMVTILYKNNSNNTISLDCEIIWTKQHSSDPSKPFFGVKILNPPNTHKNLVNTLE
jgi:hypothetical protein